MRMHRLSSLVQSSEAIEYINAQRSLESHGCKTPGKKKGKRKRKMRLSLKQSKMNTASDKYSDSLGWSTDVGRTLGDAPKPTGPQIIKVQCEMCGSMLKIPKPKRSRYTVACTYPECGHIMKFG